MIIDQRQGLPSRRPGALFCSNPKGHSGWNCELKLEGRGLQVIEAGEPVPAAGPLPRALGQLRQAGTC